MEQNSRIDQFKTWLDAQTPIVRALVTVGILTVASLVLVLLICVIAGWTTARQLSDALFYVSSLMFALALVFYFGGARGGASQPDEEDGNTGKAEDKDKLSTMMKRRRREVPFYSATFIVAGIVLFLLSIVLWEVLSAAGL